MADETGREKLKSLVSSALAGGSRAQQPQESDSADPAANSEVAPGVESKARDQEDGPADENDREVLQLIEVYFELEEPSERDALFDEIAALDSPLVTDFMRCMMEEDEDEYVRAAAAAELARRGDPDGLAALVRDLEDPEELYFFEQAVQALVDIQGVAIYDDLAAIWKDEERDADQRREAMLGMEKADSARALADFESFIQSIEDVVQMPDDQVETVMLAFVRHEHDDGACSLEVLRSRVERSTLNEDERDELVAFIQEGIDLIRGERQA